LFQEGDDNQSMSRNFEVLQRAEQEREAELTSRSENAPPSSAPVDAQRSTNWTESLPANEVLSKPPGSTIDDATRDQLTRLLQKVFLRENGCKAVVFTGAGRETGCTWVAAQAAQLLAAQSSSSVCIVDANLRSPGMHYFFGVKNHFGLSDALIQPRPLQDYVRQVAASNLWLLSSGAAIDNEAATPLMESLRARISQARSQFDYVIVDSPAAGHYHDALVAGSATDGLVLVLKANASRRETALQIVQEAKAANVRVLGTILNRRTFPVPEKIYRRL
jgi:Mrp family chromosome partitioning ATPase